MSTSSDDRFNLEVIKLLLQAAWVDGAVDPHESQMVMGLGRSWSVPEPELQALLEASKAGQRPPEPDWALLKARPDEVLMAARGLVLADGKVHAEESAFLKRVQASLGA